MTLHLKANATKAEVDIVLKKIKSKKPFDARKFAGKIQWGQDGLEYQKELRAE